MRFRKGLRESLRVSSAGGLGDSGQRSTGVKNGCMDVLTYTLARVLFENKVNFMLGRGALLL